VSRTRVKICGITRHQDALTAVNLGADAIGLVFYPPSPRSVTANQVSEIISGLPGFVTVVGLFVNPEPAAVEQVLNSDCIDCLQFHGEESADFCGSFGKPFIKAIRVREDTDIHSKAKIYARARLILLDSYSPDQAGGTGTSFDWRMAVSALPDLRQKLVLAGGLTVDNVASAIARVKPFAVDVSSGVEHSPGLKDHERMQNFFTQVASKRG